MIRALVVLALLFAGPAHADPVSLIIAASAYAGAAAAGYAITVGTALLIGNIVGGIYNSAQARSKARAAASAARDAAIGQLTARTQTVLREDPPWRVVYGETITGGDIHAIITHDKVAKREDGSTYTRPDGYQSLVIVWADHKCQAITGVQIEGVDIGAVDGNGWVTAGAFMSAAPDSRTTDVTGSITIADAVGTVFSAFRTTGTGQDLVYTDVPYTLSNGNKTITVNDGGAMKITYSVTTGQPRVRVEHYLGTTTQTASSYLIAQAAAQWTTNHRLLGKCYSLVTLDLEDSRFQGGPPNITVKLQGRNDILDPRTATTGYSTNPALCLYDWLRAPWGYGTGQAPITAADIDTASVNAAANACDVSTSYTIGTTTTTGARYTCNGAFQVGAGKEAVLQDLAESMAGHATYAGIWRIDAGAWTTPVMTLTDASTAGPIEIIQAGMPDDEIFNSVRGSYLPAGTLTPADIDEYSNATFVAADGGKLWTDITLPFTSDKARAKQICRVLVETCRNGMVIRYPAKLGAWKLQPGDRVYIVSTDYGWNNKTFRLTDWNNVPGGALVLTLQEDAAAAYDPTDATTADPTPNTDLINPLIGTAVGTVTATSGTSELIRSADGSIVPRTKITWTALTDNYVLQGGWVEACWRPVESLVWSDVTRAAGIETSLYLTGMAEKQRILIEVWSRNSFNARGPSSFVQHTVVGKTAAPSNVAGLAASVQGGQARITWTSCPDIDYFETEIRIGSTWAGGTTLFRGNAQSAPWSPYPAAGTYTVWATNYDSTGNASTPQSLSVAVTAAGLVLIQAGSNCLPNSSFTVDSNGDNIPDGWSPYYSGSFAFPVFTRHTFNGADNGPYLQINAILGGGVDNRVGISTTTSHPISLAQGGNFVASIFATGHPSCTGWMYIECRNSSGTVLNAFNPSFSFTTTWDRKSFIFSAPAGTVQTYVYLWFTGPNDGVSYGVAFDSVMISPGDTLSAYSPRADEILAGQVGTTELANGAATGIYTGSVSAVSVTGQLGTPFGTFTTICSATFTAVNTCDALFTVSGDCSIVTPSSGTAGIDDLAILSTRVTVNGAQQGPLRTYAVELNAGFSRTTRAPVARTLRFPVTAGVSYTVVLQGQTLVASVAPSVTCEYRVEEIRK